MQVPKASPPMRSGSRRACTKPPSSLSATSTLRCNARNSIFKDCVANRGQDHTDWRGQSADRRRLLLFLGRMRILCTKINLPIALARRPVLHVTCGRMPMRLSQILWRNEPELATVDEGGWDVAERILEGRCRYVPGQRPFRSAARRGAAGTG